MPPPSTPSCLQNTADENMILIKPDWTSGYAYGTSYMWFLNYRCGEEEGRGAAPPPTYTLLCMVGKCGIGKCVGPY